MQNLRKRLKALEKSLSLKRGPEVVLVQRDAVTGQWIATTEDGMKPSMPVVLFCSGGWLFKHWTEHCFQTRHPFF